MQKTTTKLHSSLFNNVTIRAIIAVLLVVSLVLGMSVSPFVGASTEQQRINELRAQNNSTRDLLKTLEAQSASYEQVIANLQVQIDGVQRNIDASVAEQNALQQKIDEGQKALEKQRAVLSQSVKDIYIKGELSMVEMLATSKNISDFVDSETYRAAVQAKIDATVKAITKLQNELKDQKIRVEQLLVEQKQQRATLDTARSEQAKLLSMNVSQQNAYNNQIRGNQNEINRLQAQIDAQRAANSSGIIPDGGYYFLRVPGEVRDINPHNYEYRNAGFSMHPAGCGYVDSNGNGPDAVDRWQYCTRQCTSFAAWAVEASGRTAPRGYGNAKQWVTRAPASQIHRSPRVGDVAISTRGTWGHVMYVAEVSGSKIKVYEYNNGLRGELRTDRWINWQ